MVINRINKGRLLLRMFVFFLMDKFDFSSLRLNVIFYQFERYTFTDKWHIFSGSAMSYNALKVYFRDPWLNECTLTPMFLYVFTSLNSLVPGFRSIWVHRESSHCPDSSVSFISLAGMSRRVGVACCQILSPCSPHPSNNKGRSMNH